MIKNNYKELNTIDNSCGSFKEHAKKQNLMTKIENMKNS